MKIRKAGFNSVVKRMGCLINGAGKIYSSGRKQSWTPALIMQKVNSREIKDACKTNFKKISETI